MPRMIESINSYNVEQPANVPNIEINPPNIVIVECPNNKIYLGIKLKDSLEPHKLFLFFSFFFFFSFMNFFFIMFIFFM